MSPWMLHFITSIKFIECLEKDPNKLTKERKEPTQVDKSNSKDKMELESAVEVHNNFVNALE
ncbi:16841_t:CDS:1, partial [Dentiscutata erythropus]